MNSEAKAELFKEEMTSELERCVLSLTGESWRDLDDVMGQRDGSIAEFAGVGEGVNRLYLAVQFVSEDDAWIALKISKGSSDVEHADWGTDGPRDREHTSLWSCIACCAADRRIAGNSSLAK